MDAGVISEIKKWARKGTLGVAQPSTSVSPGTPLIALSITGAGHFLSAGFFSTGAAGTIKVRFTVDGVVGSMLAANVLVPVGTGTNGIFPQPFRFASSLVVELINTDAASQTMRGTILYVLS